MNAVERSTDALKNDLKRAVRHSEELLENATQAVGEKACQVRQRITDAVRSASDTCCEVQQRSVEGAKAVEKFARRHRIKKLVKRKSVTQPCCFSRNR